MSTPGVHVPGCNAGCEGDSHRVLGDHDAIAAVLAPVLCSADDSMYHHRRTDDYPCSTCKATASVQATALLTFMTAEVTP